MPFIRRFKGLQDIATLLAIEGITIEEISEAVLRVLTGGFACNIGEWLKGDYNKPTELASQTDVLSFGAFKRVGDGEDPLIPVNGNGFLAIDQKQWARLAIVRVDMRLGKDTQIDQGTVDIELANAGADDVTVTIPGGTRIADNATISAATEIVAVDDDYEVTVPGLGTATTTVKVFAVKKTGASILAATDLFVLDDTFATDAGLTITSPVPAHTKLTYLTLATTYSRYSDAIATTIGTMLPSANITVIWSARADEGTDTDIRTALLLNAQSASSQGRARIAVVRPKQGTTKTDAAGDVDQGVGSGRDERQVYAYPWVKYFSPSAAAEVTVGFDSFIASLMSKLSPFENIGQETEFLTAITGFEDGIGAEQFAMNDYITFKQVGIAAARFDSDLGKWVVQSDTTTDLTFPSLKRRRAFDFVGDSLALSDAQFSKKLMTDDRINARIALWNQFFLGLLSTDNPPAQKIADFSVVDVTSKANKAKGIHSLKAQCQILPSFDVLDIQLSVGEEVTVEHN